MEKRGKSWGSGFVTHDWSEKMGCLISLFKSCQHINIHLSVASEKQMHWILEANYPQRGESSSSQHLINTGIEIVYFTENELNTLLIKSLIIQLWDLSQHPTCDWNAFVHAFRCWSMLFCWDAHLMSIKAPHTYIHICTINDIRWVCPTLWLFYHIYSLLDPCG